MEIRRKFHIIYFLIIQFILVQSNWKSVLGATGRKIWMKIHLRGATEGSQSPITAHWVVRQPAGFFSQIFLVVEPKTDFHGKIRYLYEILRKIEWAAGI